VQHVVEAELEHPEPDVVFGRVHQLAAGAYPGQQEVTVGRPLLRSEVELRVLEGEPDLEPRRLSEGQRQRATSEREAEQQPAAVAVELDTVGQRNARDRAALGLLARPRSMPRSGLTPPGRRWRASRPVPAADRGAGAAVLRDLPARGQGVDGARRPRIIRRSRRPWAPQTPLGSVARSRRSAPPSPPRPSSLLSPVSRTRRCATGLGPASRRACTPS